MNVTNFQVCRGVRPRREAPMEGLASMVNRQAADGSPLESARRALEAAKSRLEAHRNQRIEEALDGYLALRARQNSYREGLDVQRGQLEEYRALCGRRDRLSEALSAARACAGEETGRAGALEEELASVSGGISALVEQANRYADGQRRYAAYLEKTGQGGYAAFAYREAGRYSEEGFAAETAELAGRMEAGNARWGERVYSYCAGYGLRPGDFEGYLEARRRLGGAYAAARQRYAELLNAREGARGAAPSFDTVELGGAEEEKPLPPRRR